MIQNTLENKKFASWYWLLLQFLMIVTFALLLIDSVINVLVYLEPPKVSPDVKFEENYGLFAPAFYMVELSSKALTPFLEILKFIFMVVEISISFFVLWVTRYIFKQRWWAVILVVIISTLWLSHFLELDKDYHPIMVIPALMLLISLAILIKTIVLKRMQKNVQ